MDLRYFSFLGKKLSKSKERKPVWNTFDDLSAERKIEYYIQAIKYVKILYFMLGFVIGVVGPYLVYLLYFIIHYAIK